MTNVREIYPLEQLTPVPCTPNFVAGVFSARGRILSVVDVLTVFKDDIDPPLTTHTDTRTEYIQGVTTDLLVVLDLNTLLNDKRLIVYEEII